MSERDKPRTRKEHIKAMEHDPTPPPVERERLIWLTFAIIAPPLFWVLQLLFLSAFATYSCFPAYMPLLSPRPDMAWVSSLEVAGDALAILVALASGLISLRYLRLAWDRIAIHSDAISLWYLDRLCFMSLGGLLSAGGFLGAIVFETIASLMVTPCAG